MKKILLILFMMPILFACNGDDDDDELFDPYKDKIETFHKVKIEVIGNVDEIKLEYDNPNLKGEDVVKTYEKTDKNVKEFTNEHGRKINIFTEIVEGVSDGAKEGGRKYLVKVELPPMSWTDVKVNLYVDDKLVETDDNKMDGTFQDSVWVSYTFKIE